eukprot:4664784-Pleurochrysis_carterae.AAC.1
MAIGRHRNWPSQDSSEDGNNASLLSTIFERLVEQVTHRRKRLDRLTAPAVPTGGFHFDGTPTERAAAINYLWAHDLFYVTTELLAANPNVHELLDTRTSNQYNSRQQQSAL